MKKSIILLIAFLVLIFTGCSKSVDKSQIIEENTQTINKNTMQMGTLFDIQRLENSESKITKEQAQKLIPIVKQIKENNSITQEQIDSINSIYTSEQKEYIKNNIGNAKGRKNPDGDMQERNSEGQKGAPSLDGSQDKKRNFQGNQTPMYDQIINVLEGKLE